MEIVSVLLPETPVTVPDVLAFVLQSSDWAEASVAKPMAATNMATRLRQNVRKNTIGRPGLQ